MRKRYIKYTIFSILFFSTISIVYQLAIVQNPGFSIYDLAVNLLSEFAGMIFTVLIFNEFLNYRQQLADTNKFRMLHNDLEDLIEHIDFPFRAAAKKCMEESDIDIWNEETMNIIRNKIVLSEVDNCVFPAVPWYMIFSMYGEKIMRKCENIRIQYQDILEPQISDYLCSLLNNSKMLTDLSDIKKIYENDLLLHYVRPQNLGSYFACPTDNDYEVIKKMRDWLISSKKVSEKQINLTKYSKIIILVLIAIFSFGAVGYYYNGHWFYAGVFTTVSVMLVVVLIRSCRRTHS